MIDPSLALLMPYLYATFLSLVMCLIVIGALRIVNKRAYGKRTLMLGVPMLGSVASIGSVSASCLVHWLSLDNPNLSAFHAVCSQAPAGSIGLVCTVSVIIAVASFGFASSLGILNHYLGGSIAIRLLKAKPLAMSEAREAFKTVHRLSACGGINAPRLFFVEGSTPNILTVGKKGRSVIIVSVGLLETLSSRELEAVLAHEISHIRNNDNLLKTLVSSLKFYSPFIFPTYLLEPAVYREREFLADESGVALTGNPSALISALLKIGEALSFKPKHSSFSNVAMGFCFAIPRKRGVFDNHPPLEERLSRLMQLELQRRTQEEPLNMLQAELTSRSRAYDLPSSFRS
jgi:heat shock protein HtpX